MKEKDGSGVTWLAAGQLRAVFLKNTCELKGSASQPVTVHSTDSWCVCKPEHHTHGKVCFWRFHSDLRTTEWVCWSSDVPRLWQIVSSWWVPLAGSSTPGLLMSAAEAPQRTSWLAAALRTPDGRSWPERSAERSRFEPALGKELEPPWLLRRNRRLAGGRDAGGGAEPTVSTWSLLWASTWSLAHWLS